MRDTTDAPSGSLLHTPPAYRARTPWPAGAALLATIAILAVAILAAALLPPSLPTQWRGEGPAAGMRMIAVFQALTIVLTLLASGLLGGRVRDVLALHAVPGGWRTYAAAILALAALQVLLSGVQYSLLKNDMLTDLRPFIGLIRGADWALAAVVLGLGAPLSEELLFRGFLLGALARRLGYWAAAVVSTVLWTGLHAGYTLVGLAEVFLIGLVLSWLLWRTGSLRVTIFCHALYNSLIVLGLRLLDWPAVP